MGDRLTMILQRVVDPGLRTRLHERLTAAGGWRGLFDPYGAEWKRLPALADKMALIGEIQVAAKLTVGEIAERYRAHFAQRGRGDLARDCGEALRRYVAAARGSGA